MICASCGSKDDPKLCTACQSVRYCNRQCQIRHRPQHKADCKRKALVLKLAASQLQMPEDELRSFLRKRDDIKRIKSFVPPPPQECPLCAHSLPLDPRGTTFNACCGAVICYGCEADELIAGFKKGGFFELKKPPCSFCRAPKTFAEENMKRASKRAEKGNVVAMRCMADVMAKKSNTYQEAIKLYTKASDGGDLVSAYVLGLRYTQPRHTQAEKDIPKGLKFLKKAADGGLVVARYALGCYYYQEEKGDLELAMAHFALAARGGSKNSLKRVTKCFTASQKEKDGTISKLFTEEEYRDILRSFQRAREDLDSESRRRAEKDFTDLLQLKVQDI